MYNMHFIQRIDKDSNPNYISMRKLLKHRAIQFILKAQFGIALVIYATAALMSLPPSDAKFSFDILHVFGNIALYTSAWVALGDRYKLATIFKIALPYSIGIELLQVINPSRHTTLSDMCANILGLSIGLILCMSLIKLYKKITGVL